MNRIEVLLVGERSLTRLAVKRMLIGSECVAVVAEACDMEDAMRTLQDKSPRIILVDLGVRCCGLELVSMIKKRGPGISSVLLGSKLSEALIEDALRRGAGACLLLEEMQTELETAIQVAARGEIYLSAALSKKMIKWFARGDIDAGT